MKKRVLFIIDKNGNLSAVKFVLLFINIFCCLLSFCGGMIFPLGIFILFPIFILALIVTIVYITKSACNHTFEIFTLYFLPLLVSACIGMMVDQIDTKHTKQKLLESKNYVEKYYEENGIMPDEDDEYLKDNAVRIRSEEYGNFVLYYKDARICGGDEHVYFLPRP